MKSRQAKQRAFYVVIEGIDGSGKTEITLELTRCMRERGVATDAFKTPSVDGPIGKLVRQAYAGEVSIPDMAMMHLLQADALEQEALIRERIVAARRSVVLDRHTWMSGMVYQRDHHSLKRCMDVMQLSMFARPTLLVYLDIDLKLSIERRRERAQKLAAQNGSVKVTDLKYTSDSIEKLTELKQRYEVAIAIARSERWPKAFCRFRVDESAPSFKLIAEKIADTLGLSVVDSGVVREQFDTVAEASRR